MIMFCISLYFESFAIKCMLDTHDIWFALMAVPLYFALCTSLSKMFKNAAKTGWIEYTEEQKNAKSADKE